MDSSADGGGESGQANQDKEQSDGGLINRIHEHVDG